MPQQRRQEEAAGEAPAFVAKAWPASSVVSVDACGTRGRSQGAWLGAEGE